MDDRINNINSSLSEDEIDFKELFNVFLKGKWILFSVTFLFLFFGIIYSIFLPNIYESRALLVSSTQNKEANFMQNYSGLASIAGVEIGSEDYDSNAMQALEKINSLSFFEDNFMPNIFLPDLMAYESWNQVDNKNTYNSDIYDDANEIWTRDFSFPQQPIPSAQESFKRFKTLLSVEINQKTNFVTIKIKHQSPHLAKDWIDLLINQINSFYREKDRGEAERAVAYLKTQIALNNFSEINQMIAKLIQQETQKLTLIEANEFYVYEYIDPPAVMELKSEPRRSLICIFSAFLGFLISSLYILSRHYLSPRDHTNLNS